MAPKRSLSLIRRWATLVIRVRPHDVFRREESDLHAARLDKKSYKQRKYKVQYAETDYELFYRVLDGLALTAVGQWQRRPAASTPRTPPRCQQNRYRRSRTL
jgi:hypothetical protein